MIVIATSFFHNQHCFDPVNWQLHLLASSGRGIAEDEEKDEGGEEEENVPDLIYWLTNLDTPSIKICFHHQIETPLQDFWHYQWKIDEARNNLHLLVEVADCAVKKSFARMILTHLNKWLLSSMRWDMKNIWHPSCYKAGCYLYHLLALTSCKGDQTTILHPLKTFGRTWHHFPELTPYSDFEWKNSSPRLEVRQSPMWTISSSESVLVFRPSIFSKRLSPSSRAMAPLISWNWILYTTKQDVRFYMKSCTNKHLDFYIHQS